MPARLPRRCPERLAAHTLGHDRFGKGWRGRQGELARHSGGRMALLDVRQQAGRGIAVGRQLVRGLVAPDGALRARMGAAARERVLSGYTEAHVIDAVVAGYRALAGRSSRVI